MKLSNETKLTVLILLWLLDKVVMVLLFLLLVLDHFNSKKHRDVQINIQEHDEHEEGSSPCGM